MTDVASAASMSKTASYPTPDANGQTGQTGQTGPGQVGRDQVDSAELDPLDPLRIEPVLQAFRAHHPKSATSRIVGAFELSADAHKEQRRKSGEPYITHPVAVALVLANLGMDDVTLAGGGYRGHPR